MRPVRPVVRPEQGAAAPAGKTAEERAAEDRARAAEDRAGDQGGDRGGAPDPSFSYERSHPERESPSGGLSQPPTDAPRAPDRMIEAVTSKQSPERQLSTDDEGGEHPHGVPRSDLPIPGTVADEEPDHSMKDEEPNGWDQAPSEPTKPEFKRHPRTGGKGGTPDVGEAEREG